jgi:hypothetical protein
MSITTTEIIPARPGDDNAYNSGYTDGELDAISKLPARMATTRAALADQYDPLWAQGYSDGYLDEIARHAALAEKERTA